jgi:hypothetical protein
MAGKVSAKGAVITLTDPTSARTISGDVAAFEIVQDGGLLDVTGFNEGGQNFVPGLPVQSVTLDLYWNQTATTGAWTVINAIVTAGTVATMTIKPETSGLTLTFLCFPKARTLSATPDGSLKIGSVEFVQMGATAGSWA